MSIKSKLVTAAATLTLIAGVSVAATQTANAATPKCGATCSDFYSHALGTAFVLDVADQVGQAGQPATLARANRTSQGEDFTVDALGTVHDFYKLGLVSGGLNAPYGGLYAYEIEYTPGHTPSNLCLGTFAQPGAGTPATLEPCGRTAKTVWIFDPQKASTGGAYFVLISAATSTNFNHPYALTTLAAGHPLVTASLATSTTSSAFNHQLWNAKAGVLPSSLH